MRPLGHDRTGAPSVPASHCVSSSASVPSLFSASTAWLTQPVSGLPLASTSPNWSGVPEPGRQLADDHAVVELGGGDVERGRQVDHDAVDLAVLQRLHRQVVGVVDPRLGRRLDLVGDRGVGGGADLGAELGLLERGDRGRAVDLGALDADHGLGHVVVAAGEVDRLPPRVGDRDLVDVDVELLGPGRVRVGERHDDPGDLGLARSPASRPPRTPPRTRSPCRCSGRRRRTTASTRACRCRR